MKAKHDDQTYAFIAGNRTNKGNIRDWYNIWLFDSEASNYTVNDLKWFINIKFQDGHLYQAGENSKLRQGVGTIKFRVKGDANRSVAVSLSDVLYVPKLKENLMSTMTLMLRGCRTG